MTFLLVRTPPTRTADMQQQHLVSGYAHVGRQVLRASFSTIVIIGTATLSTGWDAVCFVRNRLCHGCAEITSTMWFPQGELTAASCVCVKLLPLHHSISSA
jgi:hypothetical protein